MKLIEWSKYLWCSAKESSVLGKRIVGAQQKNRRCSAKESTMLRGSNQYTLRNHLLLILLEALKRQFEEWKNDNQKPVIHVCG